MINSNRTAYLALGLFPLLLFLTSFGIQARTSSFSESFHGFKLKSLQSQSDTNYLDQLLQLGNPMANTDSKVQPDISAALLYAEQAKYISDSLHYYKGQILASYYLAYIFSQ